MTESRALTVSEESPPFNSSNNSVKNKPISTTFGVRNPEEAWD